MPLFMDIHDIHGATAEEVAKAHAADLETQRKYGVEYRKYWFNESRGKLFCLVDARPVRRRQSVCTVKHTAWWQLE
jgi:hypothetical protein